MKALQSRFSLSGPLSITLVLLLALLLNACGSNNGASGGPPGASDTAVPTSPASSNGEPTQGGAAPGPTQPGPGNVSTPIPTVAPAGSPPALPTVTSDEYKGAPVEITVWSFPENPEAVKAYQKTFQEKYPTIKVKYVTFPEDNYVDKVNTALAAHNPPDVAVIEAQEWMKSGRVVELTDYLKQWGVSVDDFNPGGFGRMSLERDPSKGIYGIGDFLGGNTIVYNKDMFDKAGLSYPSDEKSLEWPQYAEMCRKLGNADPDPGKRIYGCAAPDWGFGIWSKWLYGEDGKKAIGNMNSDAEVEAWNLGTALIRDKYAPSASIIGQLGSESDLFAQGKLAMTWTDFSEMPKYKAQKINFGIAPWAVISGSDSFVDTWTSPYGTFTESKNKEAALVYLRYVATEGQKVRAQTAADPPLNMKMAKEMNWGKGDPIKEQYLKVLQQAKPQVFVPPMGPGGYSSDDLANKLTTGGRTDAKPLLDETAQKTQKLLDKAWQEWEKLSK